MSVPALVALGPASRVLSPPPPPPLIHSCMSRQGDQVERCFQRSLEPFDTQSLHQSAYTWVRAQPAETCKPLDARFSKEGWVPREGEVGVSSYRSEFKELELPQATRCPAHSLLYPTN